MSAVPLTRFSVGELAIGISRISVRYGHVRPRFREPQPEKAGHPPGHGEQIWIFNDVLSKAVAYSHSPVLDANKALRQIPFSGKKSKPAKIRKDRWRQLALIEFPEGHGLVGQSVFQKLREFRRRHELEWDDSLLFAPREDDPTRLRVRNRRERGQAILNQKTNAVADLAAVLSGAGHGNRIWLSPDGSVSLPKWKKDAAASADSQENKILCNTTIYWADQLDRNYAESWSENVRHESLEAWVDTKTSRKQLAEAQEEEALKGASTDAVASN